MKAWLLSFAIGSGVGTLYAALRVKSPAPPLIALLGLLGMVLGERVYPRLAGLIHLHSKKERKTMSNPGIVSAKHVDHVGITVPNLSEAIRFFEEALGAQLLWSVGPFHETPTGVPIDTVNIAMLRLGPNLNVELLSFRAEQQRKEMPSNIDLGAAHIAFFVEDIHAAAESLSRHGAELLHGPIDAAGEVKKGEQIWYFKTPWGAFMEILWRPDHLPYEQLTENRLFNPRDSWQS